MATTDPSPAPPARFQEPGWFTRNVFNKSIAGLTALGVSVMGSRVLEVKGRKSGEWRATPVNLLEVDGTRWTHVVYESGLIVNVMYGRAEGSKRAVGFKLSDGMEVPAELDGKFTFARQKSKLAGTIRGSFFVVKGEY